MTAVARYTYEYAVRWDNGELEPVDSREAAERIVKLHASCEVVRRTTTTMFSSWISL